MSGDLRLGCIRGLTFCSVLCGVVLALLTVGVSAWAASEYEPNDSRETAYGPLAGGTWYTAGIDTVNDYDWYLFYVKTYSQIEFQATAAANSSGSSYFYLYGRDGEDISTGCCGAPLLADDEEVDRLPLTMTPGRYYLRVGGSQGARYKFRIDPVASITTSRECGEAIVAKDLVAPQLADVNQDLAENAEKLATRVTAVHEAKKELRQASEKAQRLRAKVKRLRRQGRAGGYLRQTSAKLRQVRSEVLRATEGLDRAKEERQPYWEEKVKLETLVGQRQGELAGAEGQIAAHC
jgi:hypothetical protein